MEPGHNRPGGLADILSNRPLIVGLLFIGTYFAPFLILIGLPLAYVFRNRPEEAWEDSHFVYLIRTFWQTLLFIVVAVAAIAAVAALVELGNVSLGGAEAFGILYLFIVGGIALAYCGVRIIISLMKSALRVPLDRPRTWLI